MASGSDNSGKPPGGPPRGGAGAPPRAPAPAGTPRPATAAPRPPTNPGGGKAIVPPPPPGQGAPAARPGGVAPVVQPVAPVVPPVAGARPPGAPAPRPPAAARPPPTIRPGAPAAGRPIVPPVASKVLAPISSPAIPAVARPPADEEEPPLLDAEVDVEAAPAGKPAPIPERGPVEQLTPQQVAALKQLAGEVDTLDYFQVLQLSDQAGLSEIKRAFYRWSRCYHPDRFFHLKGEEAKDHINALYKRITEAYYFLRDDTKRKKYVADIRGPERAKKLRFTEATEAEVKAEKKKEQEEQFGNTPKGREFYKLALAEIEKSNWSGAERNLKSALMYESGNPKFKEKLEEVKQKAFEAARAAGNTGFKIK